MRRVTVFLSFIRRWFIVPVRHEPVGPGPFMWVRDRPYWRGPRDIDRPQP